ncbi:hypothetical protein SD28_00550 [Allofrancisella guangzhouensis]|uniref:Uncharacterized protein n=2 Tax=Allofrancisella guangzhouensis TaxID=594679 RepID=A0A0A8E3Q8_9GAMM|nr:hypothetical protein [Allofrancisella guangzhouensis]AJC48257.1 hypothetical protein SD28_00550 [Allofrancisella guangzhouensis]
MEILPKASVIRCAKCQVLMSVNLPMIDPHQYGRNNTIKEIICNCVTNNCGKLLIKYDYNYHVLRIDYIKSHEITNPPHVLKNTHSLGVASKTVSKPNIYKISLKTLEILKIADSVIGKTKALMMFGASNQKKHPHNSSYNCLTTVRAAWSYGNHRAYDINKQKIIDNNTSRPLRAAAWAIKAQAGTCDNINAVAYCLCKDMLGNNVKISLVVSLSPIGHSFVVISALDNSFEDIAVDAWPIHARAILWKHHFSHPNIKYVKKTTTGILNCPHKRSRMEVLAQRCQNIPAPRFQNNYLCQPSFDYNFPTKDGLHDIVYVS